MKKYHTKIQALLAVGLSVIFLGISGCDESQDIQNWFENTAKLKATALQQSELSPYRKPQHEALKNYFSELAQMGLALKNDLKLSGRFNDAVSKVDLKAVCSKVLLSKFRWETIMDRCTKNSFFLCAEEVRAYSDIVRSIRAVLAADQQRRFDSTPSCKEAY